jgi:hypothetical protein
MRATTTLRWIALALAGFVIAAGASVAASRLAGQRIGLASEPITAGNELAPREDRPVSRHRGTGDQPRTTPQRATPQRTTPQRITPALPAAPTGGTPSRGGGDDSGGRESESDD